VVEPVWSVVDDYIDDVLGHGDDALDAAVEDSERAGLPSIYVSAPQGKLLHVLARMLRSRRILEIGTLGGYSAIWLARALEPGGRLTTIELRPAHARVARANLERAGLADKVDLRIGQALDVLPELAAEGTAPFDFTFIDADKSNTPAYYEWAVRLTRPGGLIAVDNVVRDGAVVDQTDHDADIEGIRTFLRQAGEDPRVTATAIQTVGAKGYDGLALVYVNTTG
jgi:predicted O-methyltransferase YrrM